MADPAAGNAPLVAGGGQVVQRPEDPTEAREPLALMVEAVERAADDAGSRRLLADVGLVAVIRGAWRYPDPGRLVADRIGATGARSLLTTDGGHTPQSLVNHLSARIAACQLDVAVIVGAEVIHSRRRLREAGGKLEVTDQPETTPDEVFGSTAPMISDAERVRGFEAPIHFYPTFESAVRHARGESVAAHRDRISRLWVRFNEVAVTNPHAWMRTPMTAEEIREPSPDNRMIGFPYTKAMNSNWFLDQAAAVILCSAAAADRAGVSRDRRVFVHAGTDAHDTPLVSNRADLHSSPAMRVAGRRALEVTGLAPDDVHHVDLYSCFPSAVQIAVAEIGFSEERPLTVTGGLTFAGGPLNNYVTHSIATMAACLREQPETIGFVSGNGGMLTKHAFGVYSTEPPPAGFVHEDLQAEVDGYPRREAIDVHDGPATIEGYTVMFAREGPERGLFACLLPDGRRAFGNTVDGDAMVRMTEEDLVGEPAHLSADGVVKLT